MVFADLAYRWNASDAAIERFKTAAEDLLVDMVSPGRGPAEVAELMQELAAEGKHEAEPGAPGMGWSAVLGEALHPDSLGGDLRRYRLASGMSREELSASSKIPAKLISRMEADDFAFPGAFMHAPIYLRLLSEALQVSPGPLVERFNREYGEQPLRVQKSKEYEEWLASGGPEEAFKEQGLDE